MKSHWLPTRKTIRAVMEGTHDGASGSAWITLDRVKVERSLLRKIAECPSRYHVRLHTQRYPLGVLQAQL
jgi:hypothetical protein